MARNLSLSLLALFLFAMTSQLSVSRAHLVRRSADPEPEYEFLGDATMDTQNDENTADDGDDDAVASNDKDVVLETQGENFTVSLGQTVRLPCKASSPTAVLFWTKDGIIFSQGNMLVEAPKSVTLDKNDLLVHDVKMTDMGTYLCYIAGMAEKPVVHMLNMRAQILSTNVTDEGILVEGMDVTITCNAIGFPKPTLLWTKIISDQENMRLTSDMVEFGPNSITKRNLTMSDAGIYACYATNSLNEGHAENITLHVLGKPRVHVHKSVINSAPKIEAILECTVHQEPQANIVWFKDGKLISKENPNYIVMTEERTSILTVLPQSAEDFGNFTCRANNTYGTHERSIKLVQYPVIDVLAPMNGTTFRWMVTSHLPLKQIYMEIKERREEKWLNVSIPVPEATNHTYYIEYVLDKEKYHQGKYTAVLNAMNEVDWSESENAEFVEIVFQRDDAVRPVTTLFSVLCLYLLTRIL